MRIDKLTPICTVARIEESLPFWVERLGFETLAQVEEEYGLGFVMLGKDEIVVMLQSGASLAKDLPALAQGPFGGGMMLYLDVPDLDLVLAALDGVDVVVPERQTFYGTREVWVREPGGHIVGFAQQIAQASDGAGAE